MCVLIRDLGYVAATFRLPSGFWFCPCAVNVPMFLTGTNDHPGVLIWSGRVCDPPVLGYVRALLGVYPEGKRRAPSSDPTFRPKAIPHRSRNRHTFYFLRESFRANIEGTSQSKTSNTKKQTLVFTISPRKNVSLKTKNPRQFLAGRHFFSTLNLPFNQHPCPAILFLRLPQIFSLRLCVSAFSPFSVFFLLPKVHYNALFTKIRPKHAL